MMKMFEKDASFNRNFTDEHNHSCEFPRVKKQIQIEEDYKDMNNRKQSLNQLRSPVNWKLLEDDTYCNQLERK